MRNDPNCRGKLLVDCKPGYCRRAIDLHDRLTAMVAPGVRLGRLRRRWIKRGMHPNKASIAIRGPKARVGEQPFQSGFGVLPWETVRESHPTRPAGFGGRTDRLNYLERD